MQIVKSDLLSAVEKKILRVDQVDKLWNHFESLRPDQAKFQGLHVLYYFGGILILASMSWFMTQVWTNGMHIMLLSFFFAASYFIAGNILWKKKDSKIPAGLLLTAAVGLTPLFIYGFQKYIGVWSWNLSTSYSDYHFFIREQWVYLEIGTIIAALITLRYYKFAFIAFPLALSAWYLSMDLTPLMFGKDQYNTYEAKIVSCIFGILTLMISFWANKKYTEVDFAFWGYLFGMITFWGGLSLLDSSNELGKFFYCVLNIGLIICSVYLRRKVFAIFGVIGVLGYLGHLSWEIFKDSHIFPVILALLGIFIIVLGLKYQKNKQRIEAFIEVYFPKFLLKWRPEERV